jgi:hypothetical protein
MIATVLGRKLQSMRKSSARTARRSISKFGYLSGRLTPATVPLLNCYQRFPPLLDEEIPATFLQYAADILGDTNKGLSGAVIVRAAAKRSNTTYPLPHPTYLRPAQDNRRSFEDIL